MKVKIYKKPQPRRKDSFWFDGHIATVSNDKVTVNIIAMGEICVYFNPNETAYSNQSARKEAKKRGYTDVKLNNLNKHDGWQNNNWFAFEVIKDGVTEFDNLTSTSFNNAIFGAEMIINEKSK